MRIKSFFCNVFNEHDLTGIKIFQLSIQSVSSLSDSYKLFLCVFLQGYDRLFNYGFSYSLQINFGNFGFSATPVWSSILLSVRLTEIQFFQKHCYTEKFKTYIKEILCPTLKLMDNLSIHKNKSVEELFNFSPLAGDSYKVCQRPYSHRLVSPNTVTFAFSLLSNTFLLM